MRNLAGLSLLLALLNPLTTLASGEDCANDGDPTAVESVRAQRQAFNQAIAVKDLPGIEHILHQNVLLVTGTNSDVYSGVEAQVAIWRNDFTDPDRAVYVRTPRCIRVSPIAPVALEYGSWRGERPTREGEFAAGSYAAKWRKVDADWLLESEIFATEACGGGFCPAIEP